MENITVGLTGPTGSGKSTVCTAAQKAGFVCIDADKVAREVVKKGSPLLVQLKDAFSPNIMLPDGSLNRATLAKAAFSTRSGTQLLNSIMLPYILQRIEHKIYEYRANGNRLILLDAPTLFESGADKLCNATVGVITERITRKQRIMLRDGIDEAAAELRINAGKPDEYYYKKCNHILLNNSNTQTFLKTSQAFFKDLIGELQHEN